jgi:hypothetical protein
MDSEFKRTMKLMWGHSEKFRYACGCSFAVLGVFLLMTYLSEWSFFNGRRFAYRIDRIDSFGIGTFGAICFLFYSLYGNGKMVLSSMGKWLCGSKLAKNVLVKGLMVNRLLIFGVAFVPCFLSRIRLICLGYGEYARIECFLIVWGIAYLLSAVSSMSEVAFIGIFVLYMVSIWWSKFWAFTTWFQLPVWGAAAVLLVCLVGGTLIEKLVLEWGYRNRKAGKVSVLHAGLEGDKQNG